MNAPVSEVVAMHAAALLAAGCRRIFLRNYVVDASIGIHDFEKSERQRLLINVDVYVRPEHASPTRDSIDEVVDYDYLREGIRKLVVGRHYNLQETLIERIGDLCLSHPRVFAARITTEKPDVYPDCDAVGVEVFRVRD